jgi:hypothetical protein
MICDKNDTTTFKSYAKIDFGGRLRAREMSNAADAFAILVFICLGFTVVMAAILCWLEARRQA